MIPRYLRNGLLLPGLLLGALNLFGPAAKADIACTASVGNQQNLRQEGTTEPVADIVLTCNGSLSTPQTQSQMVTVTMSAPITSRVLGSNLYFGAPTEIALLVNECTSDNGTSVTGASCSGSGSFSNGNPNQGYLISPTRVQFPFVSLPTTSPFTLRITNVRVDAHQLAANAAVLASLQAPFSVENSQNLIVGTVRPSLSVTVAPPVTTLLQCQAQTTTINNLTLSELFSTAFKSRETSQQNNVPGQWYQNGVNTESQFAFQGYIGAEWQNTLSVIPGQADVGTRIRVNISNIPGGVTVSLPTVITAGNSSLVATTAGDSGQFTAALGNAITFTSVTSGSVIYEVRSQSASALELFVVPVTVSYSNAPVAGPILVSAGYAPVAAADTFIPRFADTATPITLANVTPCVTLTSINPGGVLAGSPAFTMTVKGAGFTPNTVVTWNGLPLSTTFFDAATLGGLVTPDLIANAGVAQVGIVQPGITSTPTIPFFIGGPPTLTSISPASAPAGGPQFILTLNGTNFVSQTAAFWNNVQLATTFVSANQLMASVPAALIAQPNSSVSITAQTATRVSNALPFAVTPSTQLTLTSLSPTSTAAGGPSFTLTVFGGGFTPNTQLTFNGVPVPFSFVSANQLAAAIQANLISTPGTVLVGATASGQPTPTPLPFTITSGLTISQLSPSTAVAGGAQFTMNVTGTGFDSSTLITWNNVHLSTTVSSATSAQAIVPANLIAQPGSASVTAVNSSLVSNALPFTITSSAFSLISLTPNTAVAGGAAFNMNVTGTGFNSGTVFYWNSTALATTITNATTGTAAVPANLIAQVVPVFVTAQNVGQTGTVITNGLPFTITAAGFSISSLSPNSAPAGGGAFSMTVTGTGLDTGTIIYWNNVALSTNVTSPTTAIAAVPANLIAQPVAVSVTAQLGSLVSNALPFTIGGFSLLSLSQPSTNAGGPGFTLGVNGTGFNSGTVVLWNGQPLATTVLSSTSMTATVPASLIANPGAAGISAQNGSLISNTLGFAVFGVVTPPGGPSVTLISVSPNTAPAGSPQLTITLTGSGFPSGTLVTFNGTPLTTSVVSSNQLTAIVPASLLTAPGNAAVSITGAVPQPQSLPFTITNGLTLTSINPSTVVAGGAGFTLLAFGSGFVPTTIVTFNGSQLATTFVSPTQLSATVPASLILNPGTVAIDVSAVSPLVPPPALPLVITPNPLRLSSLNPSTAVAGGPSFALAAAGTGFTSGTTLSFNGVLLPTTFVSSTQLTAQVSTSLIAQVGTASVLATDGKQSSNSLPFTITLPPPVITSIAPSSVVAGGPGFTLTVTGTAFVSGATVSLGSTQLATTFVSATQVTAAVPASSIATAATAQVSLTNPSGQTSNSAPLTITVPAPTITSISPSSVTAGGPAFTLTVVGTNFLSGVTVSLNGTALNTTFGSATQVTAAVPANLIAQAGTAQITAANTAGPASNAVPLTIAPAGPSITSIAPTSARVGDPTFTLAVTGTGFVQASVVQWDGAALSTTFVSATQLTASIAATRLVLPASASVTVANSGPSGTTLLSNAVTFTINPVTPSITSLSSTSAFAGDPAFVLTVTGNGFLTLTNIQWNSTVLTTHFVSATQVTADVQANLLTQTGTVGVTAVNPGNNVSNVVTFTINQSVPPILSSLSRTTANAGEAAFTLTLTGTGFRSGALVNFGTNTLATTFVSATQLTANVTANLLLVPNTFQVVVQQNGTASNAIPFVVTLPPPPALRLVPPTNATTPGQQTTIDFGLNTPYPLALSGTVTVSFVSNATIPIDDPMIQLATGGRTFAFTVPPNTTAFPALQLQTGTVAGTITIAVTLTAAGVNVTPATGATATIVIARSAPVMISGKVKLVKANGYLEVDVNGFSTTRDMTQAVFHLNAAPGGSFTTTDFTVPISALFTTWYQSAASVGFGSQFSYAQTFSVIGDTNQIQSVTVTLTNSAGTSVSMTTN